MSVRVSLCSCAYTSYHSLKQANFLKVLLSDENILQFTPLVSCQCLAAGRLRWHWKTADPANDECPLNLVSTTDRDGQLQCDFSRLSNATVTYEELSRAGASFTWRPGTNWRAPEVWLTDRDSPISARRRNLTQHSFGDRMKNVAVNISLTRALSLSLLSTHSL